MAFSATVSTTTPQRGVRKLSATLLDTGGSTPGEDFIRCDQLTAFVTAVGTIAGTLKLQGSNDNANFVDLVTLTNTLLATTKTDIPATALGYQFTRLNLTGGTADQVHIVFLVGTTRGFA